MDYQKLVEENRKVFRSKQTLKVSFRIKQLRQLLRMYEENEEEFVQALKADLGKPKSETICLELECLKNDIKCMLANLKKWSEPETIPKNLLTLIDTSYLVKEPYGVVLVMGTWNFPAYLTLLPAHGAIAAGNCVIIKPSHLSPATGKLLEELLPQYIDPHCYVVVNGGITETMELLKERFDYIFFTGGTNLGRMVHQAANRHLTPVTLELGGKCPKVKELLVKEAGNLCKMWFGEEAKYSPDLARIVSIEHYKRLEKMMDSPKAKIAFGGERDESQLFIGPTVLVDVEEDHPAMREEIFGPILPLIIVKSVEEAIDYICRKECPLAVYVFSKRREVYEKIIENTSSGAVCVNDTIVYMGLEGFPFGGIGYSGMGAYHGKFSFDTFCHKKPVLIRNFNKIVEKLTSFRYPPITEDKLRKGVSLVKRRSFPTFSYVPYVFTFIFGLLVAVVIHVILYK